jgi:SAM-dependent methyltransferase
MATAMSWILYVLALAWLLDAFRMRARLASIPVLPPGTGAPSPKHRFTITPGIRLDESARTAASAYAAQEDLDLLDLIPPDMPPLLLLAWLQFVDPKTYRSNRVAAGVTTGYALLESEPLLERARVEYRPVCDSAEFQKLAQKLKRFAPLRAGFAVVPGLNASRDKVSTNWPAWEATIAGNAHAVFMLRFLMLALLAAGLVLAPRAALAAIAALHLQPLIVLAGRGMKPRGLWPVVLFRYAIEWWTWIRLFVSRMRSPNARVLLMKTRRPHYSQVLASGIGQFFEPRREDCPWCGSRELKVRIRNPDLIQQKPGRFTLEQCRSCGHTFQNPRLSTAGLAFYYSDFYDGLGGSVAETMFRARPGVYERRAQAIEGLASPSRWLDVGTGQGHFCVAARAALPNTEFDGLDISEGIDDAVRAGWLNRGYRGFLPDVAPSIAGFYDVVSLFHCLEHTPEPRKEIAAAFTALSPGGLLVIENPNPECALGRLLGRFWLPWFQPQHLHMPTADNLSRLLAEEGFEVARVQVTEVHLPIDFFAAAMLLFSKISPKTDLPWRPPSRWIDRIRHFVVWIPGFPLLVLSMALDSLAAPFCRRAGVSNAFRIVARRLPAVAERDATRESELAAV